MFVYISGLIISIIISLIIKKIFGFGKNKTLKMFISILPLTIISAFRYDVGWDYIKIYTNGFFYVGKYGSDWFSEQFFNEIIKILYNLFEDPLSLFILMSFLTALFFSLCYKVYGKINNPHVYILLYVLTRYYFCSLNIMRQALAILIVLYAVQYIKEKKIIKYLFWVIFASLFHQMAIIYLPLYFILDKDLNKKKNLFMMLITIPILSILSIYILNYTKYKKYFVSMFGNDGSILFSELIISLILLIIGIFVYRKIKNDTMTIIFFNMQFLTFFISLLSFLLPTADRICWYFSMSNIFYIPLVLDNLKNNNTRKVIELFVYIILLFVFVTQTFMGDSYSIIPYNNILEVRNG